MRRLGREQVLSALRAGGGRSLHVMEIVQILSLPKSAKDEVRDVLEDLKALGLAKELPGARFRMGPGRGATASRAGRVGSARVKRPTGDERASVERRAQAPAGDRVRGWLSVTTRGFAFVTADDGGPDVFVAPDGLGTAVHGDRVEVVARQSPQGREGHVVRVLERGLTRVAGVLRRVGRAYLIETSDARLPPAFRVVGTLPLGTALGAEVVAQTIRWPERPGEIPEVRVLRVLGPRGTAETEIAKILVREGVIEEFPREVEQEALGFSTTMAADELAGREDLRDLDFVTIDPEDARDHDDAVWAERLGDGSFRVIVAVADVSHYVREGSAIDREALARGCSIYLPGRAIPMLPPELSVHLASLVPGEDRLVLAVAVHVAENGRIRGHRLIEGVIRSRARLTYGGVARALGLSDVPPRQPEAEASLPLLRTLYAVSKALRMRRQRRGALDFELPEAKVLLDSRGEPVDVIPSREDTGIKTAYGIIEDLMLLANEVVAADLVRRKVPVIYRVHGPPDPRRVETFAAVAEAFGHPLEEDAASSPKKLQRFLRRIAGTPYEQSLSYLLLRSMQQATYDVANIGHFALATRSYLHFTSPIRRYPDLAVHRIVRMLVRGERIEAEEMRAKLQEQAIQSSRMERRAMMVEREVVNVYRCLLMKDRIGDEFEATITAVTERGLSVTVDRPFVEMRIPIERLGEDEYELDGLGIGLVGRRSGHAYVLGARLLVRLEAVALEHRELIAAPSALPDARRDAGRWRAQTRRADSRASLAPTVHPAPSSSKRRRGGSPSANRKNSRKARSSRLR